MNRRYLFPKTCILLLFLAIFGGCYASHSSENKWIINTSQISADGRNVVLTLYNESGKGFQKVVIYNIRDDEFKILPEIDSGWFLDSPSFSYNGSNITISSNCYENCDGKDELSRIYTYNFQSESWKVFASGKNWKSQPRFLPHDTHIMYLEYDTLRSLETKKIHRRHPKIVFTEISNGSTNIYDFGGANFDTVIGPNIGPDSRIYFVGIGPNHPQLISHIKRLSNTNPVAALFPYYFPFNNKSENIINNSQLPNIYETILNATGTGEVSKLETSQHSKTILFSSAKTSESGQFGEQYYVIKNGILKKSVFTSMQIKTVSITDNGDLALFLGDPMSRGFRDGEWDLYYLNLVTNEISPLPVRDRLRRILNNM